MKDIGIVRHHAQARSRIQGSPKVSPLHNLLKCRVITLTIICAMVNTKFQSVAEPRPHFA